jgi:hypothetical protein
VHLPLSAGAGGGTRSPHRQSLVREAFERLAGLHRRGAELSDKDYTAKDLDTAVASTQRDILQIADYLHAVNANLNMLRYYQSVLKPNEVKYLSNEEALDLGIAILIEETGQLVEAIPVRRN